MAQHRVQHTNDKKLLWLPVVYTSNPYPAMVSSLIGVGIVASINYWVSRHAHQPGTGNYAAYMGACPGDISDEDAAQFIARFGEKIHQDLGELLFRAEIDKLYGANVITWRH